VSWIAGRTDLLAFFFTAIALLLHLEGEQRSRPADGDSSARGQSLRHLSVLAFALAMLAKEMAVVLVAWLALIHLIVYRQDWRRSLVATGPYVAIIVWYAIWRFLLVYIPLPGTAPSHGPSAVMLSAAPTIVRYLGWLILPVDLNAYVQNPYVVTPLDPRFI